MLRNGSAVALAAAQFAAIATQATGRQAADQPSAGAAGGLGAAMLLFTPARLRPGVEIVLGAVHFAEVVKEAAFVITGEGRTDIQTAFGKAPIGVAKVAKQFYAPVFCLSGALGEGGTPCSTTALTRCSVSATSR